ncbi:MAG TPA: hypothetical protein VNN62_04020 [Methylomirabilota bacterium]|jgi:hypothetical protein|nr:hypothetical protein [Methylomirabilota bacterium]
MIPIRFFYKSRLFVIGVSLLILGVGNYLAAVSKVSHYQDVVTELTPEIPQKQPFLLREEGKSFPSETWERWEIARAKLDYYHVVLSSGRLMMSAGMACTMLALLRLRRQRKQPAFP